MPVIRISLARISAIVLPALLLASCGSESFRSNDAEHRAMKSSPSDIAAAPAPSEAELQDFAAAPEPQENVGGEEYDRIFESDFLDPATNPLSTFSIDVDPASYSNVRRYIRNGTLPPASAVRIEELVNYFPYDYPQPYGEHPVSVSTDIARAPWNPANKIVQIGIQGKTIHADRLPPSNLVFLVDVSGSMAEEDKLPLLQRSLRVLVDQLRREDHVAIVTYAGSAGLVLPPTSGADKERILAAIDGLEAGGATAGEGGIRVAYDVAARNFRGDGNNRVILATDGDFNVGVSSEEELVNLIGMQRNSGVFLTVLGFGEGNLKDDRMEALADKGNGQYAYIDGMDEARKMFSDQLASTMFTIAKDVKIQVEFNPARVKSYRLIGYENRALAARDFNDDTRDAGEIGAGHSVTALYEIVPADAAVRPGVDPLKYQSSGAHPELYAGSGGEELMTVKLRYKHPQGSESRLITAPVADRDVALETASPNLRFAAAVAEWGMLLRNSKYRGASSYDHVLAMARRSVGHDDEGYRAEFIDLVSSSILLSRGYAEK